MARHHPDNHLSPIHRKHLVATLLSFIAHRVEIVILMANEDTTQSQNPGGSKLWNNAETIALIDGLYERRAQRADSGNFKDAVYNSVAQEVAPHCIEGSPPKSAQAVRNKWQSVGL